VLDAALELFSVHGFEGTSLQDIADRLGVTKAAVYYHFHTKDEILLALVGPVFDGLLAMVDSGLLTQSGRGGGIARYVDYLLRNRRVAAYLTRDATAMGRPALVEWGARMHGQVEAMLLGAEGDALGAIWGAATLQALAAALLSAPPDASEEWLREELTELGTHLLAGYRKAVRRREG
jgi:AcrR family transcriptional regulator